MLKNKLEKKRFMKVYEELFNTDLSPNAVLLLSFLIDKEPLLKKTEGYYRIPTEFIQNSIGWSSHIIRNTLEELEEYGLIEVQVTFNKQPTKVKSGVCKSRYVKFNEEDIVNLIGEDNVEDNIKDNVNDNVNVNVEDNVKGNVKNFNIYHSKQSNQINHNKQSNIKEDISLTRNISESSILDESTIRLLLSNDEENKPISFNEYLTKEKENNINPPSPLLSNSQPTWLNNERKVGLANEVY